MHDAVGLILSPKPCFHSGASGDFVPVTPVELTGDSSNRLELVEEMPVEFMEFDDDGRLFVPPRVLRISPDDRCVCKLVDPSLIKSSCLQLLGVVGRHNRTRLWMRKLLPLWPSLSSQACLLECLVKCSQKQHDNEEGRLAGCWCHSLNSVVMVICT